MRAAHANGTMLAVDADFAGLPAKGLGAFGVRDCILRTVKALALCGAIENFLGAVGTRSRIPSGNTLSDPLLQHQLSGPFILRLRNDLFQWIFFPEGHELRVIVGHWREGKSRMDSFGNIRGQVSELESGGGYGGGETVDCQRPGL
jgi:hypothetical protein